MGGSKMPKGVKGDRVVISWLCLYFLCLSSMCLFCSKSLTFIILFSPRDLSKTAVIIIHICKEGG